MVFFCLKFFLTSIVFSLIIGASFVRLQQNSSGTDVSKKPYSNLELILYSLGLGPIFTVLILYYLLLIFPHHYSDGFYVSIILAVYLVMSVFAFKGFKLLSKSFKDWLNRTKQAWILLPKRERIVKYGYWGFCLVILLTCVGVYSAKTLQTPISQHDALIYGNLGKLYHYQKDIPYAKLMKRTRNGFYFQGSHKPSFSLLLTWERMLNSRKMNRTPDFDLFFRSITGYYGLLIIAVQFMWLFRKNRYLALLGLLVLFSGLSFYLMILNYHLDSYRIFFLLVSWIWLAYSIKNSDVLSILLLGIFTGFAAFIHPIGLVVAFANIAAFFLFTADKLGARFIKTAILVFLLLGLGNIHYLIEFHRGAEAGWGSYLSGS